jgi:sulfur-carrier protein
MPTVTIPPPYQGPTQGAANVQVDGATVEACIRSVGDRYPGFIEQVLDARGAVHRFVKLFVNGDEIDRAALDTAVAAGDEVEILAVVAGG